MEQDLENTKSQIENLVEEEREERCSQNQVDKIDKQIRQIDKEIDREFGRVRKRMRDIFKPGR